MENKESEKRRYKRIKHPFTARLRIYHGDVKPGESEKWDIVIIRDLSAGGIAFNYTKKIEIGTTLELNIALPFSTKPIYCLGQVCRIDEPKMKKIMRIPVYGIAVNFTKIADKARESIIQYADEF